MNKNIHLVSLYGHGRIGVSDARTVAEKLQMNARVVRRMLAAGKLPERRVGRIWRVSASVLDAFMSGNGPPAKPRDQPLKPEQRRKIEKKAADPGWKNKTTGAKKI